MTFLFDIPYSIRYGIVDECNHIEEMTFTEDEAYAIIAEKGADYSILYLIFDKEEERIIFTTTDFEKAEEKLEKLERRFVYDAY